MKKSPFQTCCVCQHHHQLRSHRVVFHDQNHGTPSCSLQQQHWTLATNMRKALHYYKHCINTSITSSIDDVICSHGLQYHQYADDVMLYLALTPNEFHDLSSVVNCSDAVSVWFLENSLLLNPDKTEAVIFWNSAASVWHRQHCRHYRRWHCGTVCWGGEVAGCDPWQHAVFQPACI